MTWATERQVKTTADGIVDSVGSKLTSGLKPLRFHRCDQRVVDNIANDVGTLSAAVSRLTTTADGIVESVGGKLTGGLKPPRFHRCNQARRRQHCQ